MEQNYKMPDNIKKLITYDFLKDLYNELVLIKQLSLCTPFDEFVDLSTSGGVVAFNKIAKKYNLTELIEYVKKLDWRNFDMFNGEIEDMIISNKLALNSIEDLIAKELNIKSSNILRCYKCHRFFHKNYIVRKNEYEQICVFCNGFDSQKYYIENLKQQKRKNVKNGGKQ